MKLKLTKPLVVFDLETTGLDLVKDRIIQISYIKVFPNGEEERRNFLVNPECYILPMITQLTGISNEDVKDKPTFKQLASQLNETFKGCDFAGFNSNHFDIPLLAEEFLRAGVDFDFSKCRLIDAQTIFHKMERRNLAAAYKFYCGRKMEEDLLPIVPTRTPKLPGACYKASSTITPRSISARWARILKAVFCRTMCRCSPTSRALIIM